MIHPDGSDIDFSPKGMVKMEDIFEESSAGMAFPLIKNDVFKKFYEDMFFNVSAYGKMFDILLEGNVPLYYHCSAGKDRTGVASILILLALGVRRKDAEADYLYTNICLEDSINEEVKKEISNLIRDDIKDPRLTAMISVTAVKVTKDLRYAKVYVSMINEKSKKENLSILKKSSGYIRSAIAKKINLRNTPELVFELDDSLEYGAKIDKILNDIMKDVKKEN